MDTYLANLHYACICILLYSPVYTSSFIIIIKVKQVLLDISNNCLTTYDVYTDTNLVD
jgi:hypothetical protein